MRHARWSGSSRWLLAFSLLGATLALAWLGLPAPVFVLYHRLQRDAALQNPVRARLYEVVAWQPGITIQDAAQEVGIARTTAAYHLRILGREGLLLERPSRKTVHYYRNDGRLTEEQQMRLQALASRRTRHVAVALSERPGIQRSELAHHLGISIATVNWHLRPLAERGLLREEVRGRRRLLFGTDALRESLAALARVTPDPAAPEAPLESPGLLALATGQAATATGEAAMAGRGSAGK